MKPACCSILYCPSQGWDPELARIVERLKLLESCSDAWFLIYLNATIGASFCARGRHPSRGCRRRAAACLRALESDQLQRKVFGRPDCRERELDSGA